MEEGEHKPLRESLLGRRQAIATEWHRAIAPTGFVPLSVHDVRRRLIELTDQIIVLLFTEPLERREAQALGATLARLHYIQPEALSRTQEALARQFVAGLPAKHIVILQPRLAALLGEMAAGFVGQAREMVLADQEDIRRALLTAQQEAENALRESEARFHAIFDAAAIGIGVADLNGRILETNAQFQRMFGYTADELRDMLASDFTHPDDAASDWELYREMMEGQRDHFQIEKRFYRKDGRLVWCNLTASLVRHADGRPQFSIGMMEDITERKQADATIKQLNADLERRVLERTAQLTTVNQDLANEIARRTQVEAERLQLLAQEQAARAEAEAARHRLAFLAEASSTLASSLDYKTTLASIARLAVPYLADWCAVDVTGEDGAIQRLAVAHVDLAKVEMVRELEDYHPDTSDALAGVVPVLRTGQPEFLPRMPESLRATVAQDDRTRRLLEALWPTSRIIVPLVARERKLGAITFVAAESGRHYTPADLTLAEDLGHRASVAIDNARLYHEAQDALAIRDEFLSVAAHELRTPMTNVRGYTEIMLRQFERAGDVDMDRLHHVLQGLDRQSRKLALLVTHLLDISRLEEGQLRLERVVTDITRLVMDVVAGLRLTASQRMIQVHAPSPALALVDPLRLEQVVTNLLDNAIKYSPADQPIEIEVWMPAADTACLAVRDHGKGIPPERRQRLFERFYQVHRGSTTGGLGLGLYISRRIIELHGGHIEVDFPPDGGTRFVVSLPTSQPLLEENGPT